MFTINDDLSIYVTRGDKLFFTVTAEDDGAAYVFQPGDIVRFKVYGKKDATNVVLQKDFPVTTATEKVEIYLTEDDTKIGSVISKPKDYWYEVELNPYDHPQTIIGYDEDGAKLFRLFPEGRDVTENEPDIQPEDIPVVDKVLDMTSLRPVQNQAIARAIARLDAGVKDSQKDAAVVKSELAVERARLDNLLSGATAEGSELVDIRVDADGVTHASAGKAVRNMARMSVGLNGVEQVAPKNIYGVKRNCENLFDTAIPYARGRYVYEANGVLVWEDSTGLDTYILPVDGVSKYSFTNCRTAVVVGEDKQTVISGFSSAALEKTTLDSSGGAYILFSFNYTRFPVGTYMISLGETLQTEEYEMPEWTGIPNLERCVKRLSKDNSVAFAPCIEGDLSDGSALILNARTNIRKNEIISFYGDIETMGTLEIGLSNDGDSVVRSAYVTIDNTKATINWNYSGEITEDHGLVIGENVAVTIANDGVKMTVTVISNGEKYQRIVDYVRFGLGNPYCKMTGGTATNCKLSWNAFDIKKRIWLFGDSYFSLTSVARWMKHLHDAGYTDNALVSSHAGATSKEAWTSFETLCAYGLPKMVVWCTGMNDGSDSAGATAWYTYRDRLLAFCEENNIVPVFATIPTVPTISHEEKNAWVRSGGYKYVDFAKAVGATPDGVWFNGMLSADGVHPTEKGAKNLYGRFMADFPEITVK